MGIDFNHLSLDPENGVLPVLGKVLEKVQIMVNKDAFRVKENEHAFSHGRTRSTVSALVNITQTWFDDSDNITGEKKPFHSLFIDFNKALVLVDHSILLTKLKERKINKSLWQWLRNFLQDRTQPVKFPGVLSTTRTCPAGRCTTMICYIPFIVQYLQR